MKQVLLTLMCLLGWAGTALAVDCTTFSAMDANGNGTLDLQEFKKAYPQMHDAAFLAMDSNKDSTLTCEEWGAFLESHRKGQHRVMPQSGNMPTACPATPPQTPLITPPAHSK